MCLNLGPQLAAMVLYHQEHQRLQRQTIDLTDRLQAAQGKYHQFANIVESISDGVVVSDTVGKIKLVNKAAERLLDRSKDKLMTEPFGLIYGEIDSPESIEKLAAEFSRGSQALPTYFERNGLAIKGQLIPLRNHRQEWLGQVALLRDVTAEVNADRAKSQFINTISREIRTPLTTMKGYLDLVIHGAAGKLEPEQQRYLNLIKAGTDHVTETISNALLAVEDKTDLLKLDVKEMDVRRMIRSAIQAATALFETKHLTLTLQLEPDLPPIQADETRLKQVIYNLLSNACRYTREDGEIFVRAWIQWEGTNGRRAKFLIIAVADGGIGIPLEEQGHIFEPYYQVPNEINNRSGGIGLGLSIVKELVEAHGGRVWVESAEGEGSTFQVALPVA
jgi:signal transduction histidine kinase